MIFKEHSFVILTFTFMCLQVPALPVHLSSHSELTTTLQKTRLPFLVYNLLLKLFFTAKSVNENSF